MLGNQLMPGNLYYKVIHEGFEYSTNGLKVTVIINNNLIYLKVIVTLVANFHGYTGLCRTDPRKSHAAGLPLRPPGSQLDDQF